MTKFTPPAGTDGDRRMQPHSLFCGHPDAELPKAVVTGRSEGLGAEQARKATDEGDGGRLVDQDE